MFDLHKSHRYQIAISGKVYFTQSLYELQDSWLSQLGTCPEWGLYDTVENKYVEATWENLGLDPNICAKICSLRMEINSLWEKARRTRKLV